MLHYTMLLFSVFMVIDFVCSSEYFFDPYLTFFATILRSMQFILSHCPSSLLMVLSTVTLTYIARILYSMNIKVTGLLK